MGLLDQILGNAMGAGQGRPQPQARGGTSPVLKALLLLLAAKAYQHYTSRPQSSSAPAPDGPFGTPSRRGGPWGDLAGSLDPRRGGPMETPTGGSAGAGMGGLGGMLGGGLGGLLAGLAGSGGLGAIVDQFRRSGYGDQVDSWVGRGQNQPIAPNELEQALGPETIDELQQQTGMPREEMLSELSDVLPEAVDQFTPDGRLPTEDEAGRWV